jgi:hypothetical protein
VSGVRVTDRSRRNTQLFEWDFDLGRCGNAL